MSGRFPFFLSVLLAGGCSCSSRESPSDGGTSVPSLDSGSRGADSSRDAGRDSGTGCVREPAPADRERRVVIAHPYSSDSSPSSLFEVWSLSESGELTNTGTTFELARAFAGEIQFTPDGKVGIVAEDDGTLGVFRFTDDGVEVVHDAFEGDFAASQVVISDLGDRLWVLDSQFPEHGGGLYELQIDCEGRLHGGTRTLSSKLPYGLVFMENHALLVARSFLGSPENGDDVLLLSREMPLALIDGADAFGDDDAIVSGVALTPDERFLLLGDTSFASENRVAIVEVGESSLSMRQLVPGIEEPRSILVSPSGDAVLVVSGLADALLRFTYDPDASDPFANQGELTYSGAAPELPSDAVMISRGLLTGLVLVSENTGIRRVRFDGDGMITDLGKTSTGSGIGAIVGAIGVQP